MSLKHGILPNAHNSSYVYVVAVEFSRRGTDINLQEAIQRAMEFVAPRNYCSCKVTSVVEYKLKPTDLTPTAHAIELEADYSDERVKQFASSVEGDAKMLVQMMSNGPFRIRVVSDGKQIFAAEHFDDYVSELRDACDLD